MQQVKLRGHKAPRQGQYPALQDLMTMQCMPGLWLVAGRLAGAGQLGSDSGSGVQALIKFAMMPGDNCGARPVPPAVLCFVPE